MILDTIKKKAKELTIKAEGLQEAIGEGGIETFSEEQLTQMQSDMEQAFARASKYYKILNTLKIDT